MSVTFRGVFQSDIAALSDDTVTLPVNKILTKITEGEVDRALAAQSLESPLETSVNAFLINTGATLTLIDTGAAKLFGAHAGQPQRLRLYACEGR